MHCATLKAYAEGKSNLLVRYAVKEIGGKGKGLVAGEFIAKGTCVWKPNAVRTMTDDELMDRLFYISAEADRQFVLSHVYGYKGRTIELLDDSMYTNHSSNPNMGMSATNALGHAFALRDIQKGEELTENYAEYECSKMYLWLCQFHKLPSTADIAKQFA